MQIRYLERLRVGCNGAVSKLFNITVGTSLTLSKISDTLTIHRGTMFINIGHEELAEVPYDRPANAIISDPLYDRFGLDVA